MRYDLVVRSRRAVLPEQRLEVQRARAGGAPVGHVGDLDVRDVGGLAGQHARQVLTHCAQVVQVGQERHVGDVGLRPHQVDHLQRPAAGNQRRARAVAGVQRLHDHRGAGRGGGARGQREVLRGELVLLALGQAVGPVPVQRVEDGAPGPRGDAGADVDVGPEGGRTLRQRQQPALTGRHVTADEVQQRELHPGVRERPGEGVDLAV